MTALPLSNQAPHLPRLQVQAAYRAATGWYIRGSYSGLRWNALTELHATEEEAWGEFARKVRAVRQEGETQ